MKARFLKYKWYIAVIGLILLNFARHEYLSHTLEKSVVIESHKETQIQNKDSTQLALEKQQENSQDEKDIVPVTHSEIATLEEIPVYICGAVESPGVYYVPANSIVDDVVKQSGGLTDEADLMAINLAEPVNEHHKIIIPKEGEEEFDKLTNSYENNRETNRLEIQSQSQLININLATKEELMGLNGIGEVKANDVINYRTEKGLFQSIEEIKQVSGIGEKTFEKIKAFITV